MLYGRLYSKTFIWQGDPTSAPPPPGDANRPVLLVQPQPRPSQRGQVTIGAAPAAIPFGGPLIVAPIPQRPRAGQAIIVRQLQDGAAAQQSGPVPTALVVTRPQRPVPGEVFVFAAPPEQTRADTPTPVLFTRTVPPAGLRTGWVIIRLPAPEPSGPGEPPDVETPTGLVLDAHENRLTLDAHLSQLVLDAHESGLTLDAHEMGLILDKGGDPLATPVFYTGDTWEPLKATAVDANGNAVNISTATSVRMVAKRTGGAEVITGTTVNLDDGQPANRGRWSYTWASGDLAVAGDYVPELEVTWPGGPPTRIQTYRTDTEKFVVKADND